MRSLEIQSEYFDMFITARNMVSEVFPSIFLFHQLDNNNKN